MRRRRPGELRRQLRGAERVRLASAAATIEGVDRFIGSPGCKADDVEACNPCTKQNELCGNPCEDGEICYPEIEPSRC